MEKEKILNENGQQNKNQDQHFEDNSQSKSTKGCVIYDTHNSNRTRILTICAIFVALVAVGAFIKIPIPIVPFSLQFMFVAMAGIVLGKKYATFSMSIYVLMGLIGLPIFTQGGGIGYVLKPTFGYLIGFIVGAFFVGWICEKITKPNFFKMLSACIVGLIIVYIIGILYMYFMLNFYLNKAISLGKAILIGGVVFLPGDVFSSAIAVLVANSLRKIKI